MIARLLGLQKVIAMGRAAEHSSDYWLHHVDGETERISRFIVVAGLAACVADQVVLALMEDLRVALQVAHFSEILHDETHGLEMLDCSVWRRVAGLVSEEEDLGSLEEFDCACCTCLRRLL